MYSYIYERGMQWVMTRNDLGKTESQKRVLHRERAAESVQQYVLLVVYTYCSIQNAVHVHTVIPAVPSICCKNISDCCTMYHCTARLTCTSGAYLNKSMQTITVHTESDLLLVGVLTLNISPLIYVPSVYNPMRRIGPALIETASSLGWSQVT